MIKIDNTRILSFVNDEIQGFVKSKIENSYNQLVSRSGKGNDFLGWLDLPGYNLSSGMIYEINIVANQLASISEVVVVIGIGGSYLGARAVIEALGNNMMYLNSEKGKPAVIYAGNQISEDYMSDLLCLLDKRDYSLVVISKSGTTTEPAIAFRILKSHCELKYGKEESKSRIVAITDENKGALRKLADNEGYNTFVIPDNVGGRFSVLTPVGLLPIATAGFDIDEICRGAEDMRKICYSSSDINENPALKYVVSRNMLYQKGYKIELMVNYLPSLVYFTEWWKQLYGESEGKENKGLFPAGVSFSTDLHSMGQYIQQGERHLFETMIWGRTT